MARLTKTWFCGGDVGGFRIRGIQSVKGPGLPDAARLHVGELLDRAEGITWTFGGVATHLRYTAREEKETLASLQPPLGRPESTSAVLIPITKSGAWWDLAQDERRTILEQRSKHIETGREYLPAIARKLYHGRELGEPFDFLTWFEFAPKDERKFDELLQRLRRTEEWTYVEREVEIRLTR
jgi:chlorite dismutase